MDIPIPDFGQAIKGYEYIKPANIEPSPLISEYRKAIIALNCMMESLLEHLPEQDRISIMNRYSALLSEKNLRIIR